VVNTPIRPLSDEKAAEFEERGSSINHVEDGVLDAWRRHCDQDLAWQTIWRALYKESHLG
jgi:hypothetical protein